MEKIWGVGQKTAEKMHRMGIFTGLDLRNMSLTRLTQEFGIMGQVFYDFSRVIDNWPVISTSLTKYHIKYHHQDEAYEIDERTCQHRIAINAIGAICHQVLCARNYDRYEAGVSGLLLSALDHLAWQATDYNTVLFIFWHRIYLIIVAKLTISYQIWIFMTNFVP